MRAQLHIDSRQAAILKEMGIAYWAPAQAATAGSKALETPIAAALATAPVATAPFHATPIDNAPLATFAPSPANAPVAPPSSPQKPAQTHTTIELPVAIHGIPIAAGISTMEIAQLGSTLHDCAACTMRHPARAPVWGVGASQPSLMILCEPPSEDAALNSAPYADADMLLIRNMLRALNLAGEPLSAEAAGNVFISPILRCAPSRSRNPEAEELQLCSAYWRRQVALAQPKLILALGRLAAQSILGSEEPLGKLRGRAHDYHGAQVVVSLAPDYLRRYPNEKAKAWQDWCLAAKLWSNPAA